MFILPGWIAILLLNQPHVQRHRSCDRLEGQLATAGCSTWSGQRVSSMVSTGASSFSREKNVSFIISWGIPNLKRHAYGIVDDG
jgi:hypothetical protein